MGEGMSRVQNARATSPAKSNRCNEPYGWRPRRMPEPDVLVTKVTIPPVRSVLLQRPRLLAVLDQSRSFPLTLLSASAGFGKTTLLSAWASQSASRAAWLSLDEQDND